MWETRGKQAKDLMGDMLKSRLEAQELAKRYNLKHAGKASQVRPPCGSTCGCL